MVAKWVYNVQGSTAGTCTSATANVKYVNTTTTHQEIWSPADKVGFGPIAPKKSQSWCYGSGTYSLAVVGNPASAFTIIVH